MCIYKIFFLSLSLYFVCLLLHRCKHTRRGAKRPPGTDIRLLIPMYLVHHIADTLSLFLDTISLKCNAPDRGLSIGWFQLASRQTAASMHCSQSWLFTHSSLLYRFCTRLHNISTRTER